MINSRRKILIFLYSFLAGVFIAPDFVYLKGYIYILILVMLLLLILSKGSIVFLLPLSLLGIFIGCALFLFRLEKLDNNRKFYNDNSEVVISGYIASYPQEKEKSTAFILDSGDQRIYVLVPKVDNYRYGQKLKISGKINKIENEDEFSFKDYFLTKKIFYQAFYPKVEVQQGYDGSNAMKILSDIRLTFENKTNEIFVKPYSSFVLGILLGVKSLSNNLMEMFSKVSLSHIIVVSGYNLSIIAEVLKKIFYPKSRKFSFWVPIVGIWIFTFLVGADAPVVRAAIMSSVIIFSRKEGKKSDGISVLTMAAFFMVTLNPFILRYDPGFQLSFLSTLGIILYCDRIEHFIKLPKTLSEIISATLSAQILILPVIAYYFGRVSLMGPIANFIVLPFIPVIMFLSFFTIIIGFINTGLAQLFSFLPVFLILFCMKIAKFLSELSFSFVNLRFNPFLVIFYFFIIFFISYLLRHVKKKKS